jgi:ABC-2 type transport system ATP-binding protein
MADQLVIDVQDLRKRYGDTRAIDGVSFAVHRGEVFGMLGPNGAGKTTTIECLEGLRDPDAGSIQILGMRQGPDREQIKSRIGLQLQTTGLYPKLSVIELLELFATFYPNAPSVQSLIDLVGLNEKRNTRSKDLSGGQRQRLSLALALVGNPDIVFLDEPTTGLDPQARRAVWDVVQGLKQQGRTVMLTTHYMEEAEQLCDRVAVMDHGLIIELDSPSALVSRFFQETAIEFAVPDGWPTDQLASLAGVNHHMLEDGRVVLYSIDVPHTMAALFNLTSNDNLAFSDISVRQATLEDVFLKLTGRRIRE